MRALHVAISCIRNVSCVAAAGGAQVTTNYAKWDEKKMSIY